MSDLQVYTELRANAEAFIVASPAALNAASELIVRLREKQDEVRRQHDGGIDAAHKAHKQALADRDLRLAPLNEAVDILAQKRKDYTIAETRRIADENARRQREAEAAEAKRIKAEAKQLEKTNQPREAAALRAQPIQVVVEPVAPVALPKGTSIRKRYKITKVDMQLLPREFCEANMVMLNGVVRSMGEATSIPGVTICEDVTIVDRRRQ